MTPTERVRARLDRISGRWHEFAVVWDFTRALAFDLEVALDVVAAARSAATTGDVWQLAEALELFDSRMRQS